MFANAQTRWRPLPILGAVMQKTRVDSTHTHSIAGSKFAASDVPQIFMQFNKRSFNENF